MSFVFQNPNVPEVLAPAPQNGASLKDQAFGTDDSVGIKSYGQALIQPNSVLMRRKKCKLKEPPGM